MSHAGAPLLEVTGLHVEFRTRAGVARAVNGISFRVAAGETLVILGESGSGKSVTAQAIMGILDQPPASVTEGSICLSGIDLIGLTEPAMRRRRGAQIAIVFQDALSALNPVASVGRQIGEMFTAHRGVGRAAARAHAIGLLQRVGIPQAARRVDDFPHEFSGGMRQRVMIAMALALDPALLIADEPTTALDVTVQAQVLDLLAALQRERNMAMILITHDLDVVAEVADHVVVMYAGRAVESADVSTIFERPAHPYTRALLQSVPRLTERGHRLQAIGGAPPNLLALPSGCSFHPRCPRAEPICAQATPPLVTLSPTHVAECHFVEQLSFAA